MWVKAWQWWCKRQTMYWFMIQALKVLPAGMQERGLFCLFWVTRTFMQWISLLLAMGIWIIEEGPYLCWNDGQRGRFSPVCRSDLGVFMLSIVEKVKGGNGKECTLKCSIPLKWRDIRETIVRV